MLSRILSLIGWLGIAMVFLAFGIRFGFPAREQYVTYLVWPGLACLLIYIVGQWRDIARLFSRRQARYGTLSAVSILVVLGILIAVNYIGQRQNKRWDLTANKTFSLSDQTRNVLSKLDAPLQVLVFARDSDVQSYQDQLKEYEYASKNVSTQYIDPDKKPALAKQNQIQQYGTIVFNYKGRTERVTSNTEQDITSGIIKVVSGQTKKVYFTQGHGEHDPKSSDRDGYNAIAGALARDNYAVDTVALAQAGKVPDDAAVVVVAGPKTDFFPPEIDALQKYLAKAGKLLLELDPPEKLDSPPIPNLTALAHDWGIAVGNSIVVDASGMGRLLGAGPEVPIVVSYPPHAITQRFNGLITGFPLVRPAEPVSGGVNGHTAQPVAQSGPQSWAEADIKGFFTNGNVTLDEKSGDRRGPITIASATSATTGAPADTPNGPPPAIADAPKPETRVVVFGDSDFAANNGLGITGNRDLFMNTIGWLSQQENLISIRPKEADDRRLAMTATQQANINWASLLLIPGVIFGTGIYSWWRRR